MTNCFDDDATIEGVYKEPGIDQGSRRGVARLKGDGATALGIHYQGYRSEE